ncbi:uncharacterized protein LOC126622803 [Malus sylvestris]|uniref:uncharacterized protein LOC126622803 n=1 Tax=Malus sylvestris TaxID=3752 RepID=UPI0021AC101A|nr:uncharacterized protein LOC126622803 [Malus sylvestris]
MAPTRKYPSGYLKRQRKRKIEQLTQSQKGAIDRFFLKEKEPQSSVDDLITEQQDDNEQLANDLGNDEIDDDLDEKDNHEDAPIVSGQPSEFNPSNIYDPQIWDSLDPKWIDFLAEKGPGRDLSIEKGPKDQFNRRFNAAFYTQYLSNGEKHDRDWLVYSNDVDKVFCFCCKLFKKGPLKGQLANDGYIDWTYLNVRLKEHENSFDHISNMTTWIDLRLRLQKNETIDKVVQDQIKKEKEHWRELLRRLISIVKYLAKYTLAFRGNNDKLYQENNGNFMGLVQMMAESDPLIKNHLQRFQNNEIRYHYLSHTIQNELILLISCEIKAAIIQKVKEAKYFAVILDCTPDFSHQEQMTLIIRCVDMNSTPVKVEEYFLQYLIVNNTSREGLFEELQNVLKVLNLDIDDVRGQGYDNGSNMKGRHQGVQKRLLDINPRAMYTPCGCHSLNLTLCDMANSCGKAKDFFGTVQRIYSLFANSTKRWLILKENIKGLTLKSLSTTRWESRVASVKAIQSQPLQIKKALLQLAESDNDLVTRSAAKSLATYDIGNFEFLLGMTIWYDILADVNEVSKDLQSKDMLIDVAIEQVQGLIAYFEKYRETGFAEAMINAKKLAIEMEIDPVFPEKRQVRRKRHFDENEGESSQPTEQSAEESFRVHYFLYIIDQAIGSLKRRFEEYQAYDDIFGFLFTSERLNSMDNNKLKDSCDRLQNFLKKDELFDVDGDALLVELKLLRERLPKEIKTSIDILNYLKRMRCFPTASVAYRILLTIPITIASA